MGTAQLRTYREHIEVAVRVTIAALGDDAARGWFEEEIRARWPKIKIFQPQPAKTVVV